ncbi:hypothetical protein ACFWVP_23355 [Streptomyces sp. NPDC058637]|uniref:hypothetical protein n=1 Tax=Streptomyces sp. NPDC058637 TaxID=3346569 RepID=UPI003652638D
MTGSRRATVARASSCPATTATTRALSENDAGHTGTAAAPLASVHIAVAVSEFCGGMAMGHIIAGSQDPHL